MTASRPRRTSWLAVRKELDPRRRAMLGVAALLWPFLLWSLFSYTPIWKPKIQIVQPGGVSYFTPGDQVDRTLFDSENAKLAAAGKPLATGFRTNPVYFPAPHQVLKAFYTAFKTPPLRNGEPWLHESLLHSIRVICLGFLYSSLIGLPLGILCGTFALFSRTFEPPIDFIRYTPAPAFGALMVSIFGIEDAPKVAIIFIGTFFQMVLVIANTTRLFDPALLEAAQTLGASKRRLVTHVVIPGILPNIYSDMRILLGWAWTYLIVAELIGHMSGISYFIYQQARYLHYENVYAAIMMIGIIGLVTDQVLAILGRSLFPWQGRRHALIDWFWRKKESLRIYTPEKRYARMASERVAEELAERELP